jgi:hypothetical protein
MFGPRLRFAVERPAENAVPNGSSVSSAELVTTAPVAKLRRFARMVTWLDELRVMFLRVAVDPERDSSKTVPRVSTLELPELFHSMLFTPDEAVTETLMFPSDETISPGQKAKPCLLSRAFDTGSRRMLMSPFEETSLPAVEPKPNVTPQWFRVVSELEFTCAEMLILPVAESIVV